MTMKNYMKAIAVSVALCALAGCKSDGDAFVGVWKTSTGKQKTLTVTKVDSSFKVVEVFNGGPQGDFAPIEVILTPKSDKILVTETRGKTALLLSEDGNSLTSYIRAVSDSNYVKVQ